jgi:enoyl-CoA hydratase/carnithine racemase
MIPRKHTCYEIAGYVATIRLDNPPLNLVTEEMKRELLEILEILESNDQVKVLVVTGAGEKAFCAGRDLNQSRSFQETCGSQLEAAWDQGDRLIDRILFYPKLTIAALNGAALGGGCELTLPFDLVIARRGIHIGLPETMRGLFPGTGAMKLLPRKVGFFKAREIVFLGKVLTAEAAQACGLVNEVVDQPALTAAMEFAKGLGRVSFQAMMQAKEIMNRHERWPESASLHYERAEFSRMFSAPDGREGVNSFFEKREPKFEW